MKPLAWRDATGRQSKRRKVFGDIARLAESHPDLWQPLPEELKDQIDRPQSGSLIRSELGLIRKMARKTADLARGLLF